MRIFEFDEFEVDLEYNETFVIAHLPSVSNFRKDTYLRMHDCVEKLHDFVTTIGYQNLFAAATDPKVHKLMEKLGFAYVGEQDGLKVYAYGELV